MAERVALKPPHPSEAENWDDDFEFHSPTEDHPKTGDVPVRTSTGAANRDSIVWDDDDEPLEQKLASKSGRAPQADSGDWGDSDDDGLAAIRRGTLAPKTLASPDPSPSKWTTDGEDNFGPNSSPYDVDRTVTLNNRSNFPPPPADAYNGTRSAMSSSASLPSSSQHHVHIPNPHDRYSPTPYSPTSPTLSSAFSMGTSSTAHLRQTTSRHSSMVSPPIVYQPPPRPRRRLRKKSRPPQTEVGDIFEMEEQHRGFQDELEESMDTNHQSPKSSLHRRPGSSAGPSAHQIFSQPAAPALRSRSKSQSSQPPSHHPHQGPRLLQKQPPLPTAAQTPNTSTEMREDVGATAEGTSQSFVPSSPSGKTPLLSRIGSMKNWSSKRKARHSSQSSIHAGMHVDAGETSSASESHWHEDDRPLTTPEPARESTESPSSWAYRDSSPPVDSPSETSGVLSRKGSRRSYASSTRKPKPALSKVLGIMASNTVPSTGQERSLRRPMSLVQQPPSRPSSSSRPATYGRSTSNPFIQEYSSSSSSKSRPALSNSASLFGLKGLAGIGNHRRNKSIGADSAADESFSHITSPALPPLPSTPRTPRPSSPAPESRKIVSDKPPVLPALPPIDIELSPPSPPRLLASASQPVQSAPTSFMVLSQHFPGIAAGSSPSRSPGGTSSLGRANGIALLAGGSPGSMRRNSLGDLKIPARISRNQVALKSNLTMVREFAAIVEQLKDFQNNYSKAVTSIRQTLDTGDPTKGSVERLGNGHGVRPPGAGPPLLHDPALRETTETLKRLDEEYSLWWECAELLIELGGGAKDEKDVAAEPEPIPESPTESPTVLASKSSVALVEPPQSFGMTSHERERAITLGGTESSALAASAVAAAEGGKRSGPWRASTGRHGLSQRQLVLLKEMLTTPDPSTLSLPLFSSPTTNPSKPQNPLTFKDPLGPPPSFQHRPHQPYRSNFPTASAITLPESTTSSSAPSRSRSRLPPVSFGSKDRPSSPTKGESKVRRGSRLGLNGIRDMLRSLKKATAAQQPAILPSVQSKANESQSSFDSRQGHGAPPSAPLPARQVSRTRKGKGSTDASAVTATEANMSPEPNRSPMPEFPSRPFSSQANRKSPRRPSLASLFRIGNSNKGERKKSGKQQPSAQDSGTGNASSAADTTTEDDSDWDRIDSASDLDISFRSASRAETADMEHDKSVNQATVRGRRTLPPTVSPESPPPLPSAYPGIPSASHSSLSLRNSPQHRPTRLPMSIKEEGGYPPPTQRSTSYTHQRPPSRGSRTRQATIGSLPPMPFNSLLATLATAPNERPTPEETTTQAAPNPQPPLPPPSPEVRLAMTPENIKPLLECSREVSARLNDCLKELERLNLALMHVLQKSGWATQTLPAAIFTDGVVAFGTPTVYKQISITTTFRPSRLGSSSGANYLANFVLPCHPSRQATMPFISADGWPVGLLTIFDHARAKRTSFESRYYGPYDKLLNYCFGDDFTFYVAPQNPPRDGSRDAVDFIVFFVVFDSDDKPVMVVEVKNDGWAEKAELRYRADSQMRDKYALMLDECPNLRLWGLSLLGTSVRVYCADKESYELQPPAIPHPDPSRILLPTFLAGEWNMDILSQEGFAKMKEIVTDIMASIGDH
ncbi:hypothetical protein FRC05_005753 [Tulasnella sp. 425]|nr:hypothetical protein FRC05_005753 [Tulasnella sp. 425]